MSLFLKKYFIELPDRCLIYSTSVPLDLNLGIHPLIIQTATCFKMKLIRSMWSWKGRDRPYDVAFSRVHVALYGGIPSLIRLFCDDFHNKPYRIFHNERNVYMNRIYPFMNRQYLKCVINAFVTGHLYLPSINSDGEPYANTHVEYELRSSAILLPHTEPAPNKYLYRWPLCYIGVILDDWMELTRFDERNLDDFEKLSDIVGLIRMIIKSCLLRLSDQPGTRAKGKDFGFVMTVGILLWLTFLCLGDRFTDNFPLLDLEPSKFFQPKTFKSVVLPFEMKNLFMTIEEAKTVILDHVTEPDTIYHVTNFAGDAKNHCYLAHLDQNGDCIVYGLQYRLQPPSSDLLNLYNENAAQCAWLHRVCVIATRTKVQETAAALGKVVCLGSLDIDKLLGFSLHPLRELYEKDDPKDLADDEKTYVKLYNGEDVDVR